jgi:hypothetical protein
MKPIIPHKYDIGFVAHKCNLNTLAVYEPWCSTIYIEDEMGVLKTNYIELEQQHTKIDLEDKIKLIGHDVPNNNIVVEFDVTLMNQDSFNMLTQLPEIIAESGDIGTFKLDIFKIDIKDMTTYEHNLINIYNK